MWPLVCPSGVASLLDRCLDKDVNQRPTFQEIHQILAKVHVHNIFMCKSDSFKYCSKLNLFHRKSRKS